MTHINHAILNIEQEIGLELNDAFKSILTVALTNFALAAIMDSSVVDEIECISMISQIKDEQKKAKLLVALDVVGGESLLEVVEKELKAQNVT